MNMSTMNIPVIDKILLDIVHLPGSYVLLVLSTLVCVGVGLTVIQQRQQKRLVEKNQKKQVLNELKALVQSQSSAMLLLSERIHALEEYLELVGSRQQRLEQVRHSPQQSYQNAIQVANTGAGPEELVSRCGLSSPEAELISQLYGKAS